MTSISSIGSSFSVSQAGATSGGHRGKGKGLEDDLTNFLTQQGVSADDQKAIQAEIKDGISSASNGGRPSFADVKDVVKQVLDKHGISGDDFVSQMPKPPSHGGRAGGPPPGPPPTDAQSGATATDGTSSTDDSSKSWLQKLLALLAQKSEDESKDDSQVDPKSNAANNAAAASEALDVQA